MSDLIETTTTLFNPTTGETIAVVTMELPPPPPDISALRTTTSNTRYQFCTACLAAGILTAPEAIAASRGEWPAPLDGFLAYLSPSQSTDAQMEWANCVTVERMHPFVLSLASYIGLTDKQVDALFGID